MIVKHLEKLIGRRKETCANIKYELKDAQRCYDEFKAKLDTTAEQISALEAETASAEANRQKQIEKELIELRDKRGRENRVRDRVLQALQELKEDLEREERALEQLKGRLAAENGGEQETQARVRALKAQASKLDDDIKPLLAAVRSEAQELRGEVRAADKEFMALSTAVAAQLSLSDSRDAKITASRLESQLLLLNREQQQILDLDSGRSGVPAKFQAQERATMLTIVTMQREQIEEIVEEALLKMSKEAPAEEVNAWKELQARWAQIVAQRQTVRTHFAESKDFSNTATEGDKMWSVLEADLDRIMADIEKAPVAAGVRRGPGPEGWDRLPDGHVPTPSGWTRDLRYR